MNRTLLSAIVLALGICGSSAGAWAFDEVLVVPWGRGPGNAGHRREPSGSYGPTDFAIADFDAGHGPAGLFLLDREQGMLQVFDVARGGIVGAMTLPPMAERVAVEGDDIALWDGEALYLGTWGGSLASVPAAAYPFRAVQRLAWHQGDVVAIDERGQTLRLTRGRRALSAEDVKVVEAGLPRIAREVPGALTIEEDGNRRAVALPFDIGAVEYVGAAAAHYIILVDEILSGSPIQARQVLVILPRDGPDLCIIPVPRMYFTWIPHSFVIVEETLYGLISSPKGIHLFAANATRLADPDVRFPAFPEEPYHCNDHLPASPPAGHGWAGRDEDPISRFQMMANAREFVNLQWSASSGNITSGIQQLPDGSYVRTPAWVTVGAKRKVPYKWGGFTSTSTFAAGVPLNKKCGDDYTESVSWTDLYCIGVDCSGFVSRCWDTSQKYGTSTLSQIANQLPSFSLMRRGDCLNLASSHVRLCAEDTPPGMVLTLEASAYDWRVSYRSYTLTALSSYVPMRFNWVEEEEPVAPFVVKVKDVVTELNVRQGPSTAEAVITTIAADQRFASTCAHDGWYHIHIPSGTGTYGGWAMGGTTSINGYLEGSQSTAIATVTTSVLNVREGPGTGYALVTTAAEGQHFAILSSSAGWYQLQLCNTPGFTAGWVSGAYLSITPGGARNGYGASVESVVYCSTMNEGETAGVTLDLTNAGQCGWDDSTMLATTVPRSRASVVVHGSWADSAVITVLGAAVLPFQSHTVGFQVTAPQVGADTVFNEHFGLRQAGFCWFGDPDQRGPADDAILLSILVREGGELAAPEIALSSVDVISGQLTFSWSAVAGAASYGVFRGSLAGAPEPLPVTVTTGFSYANSHGIGDVDENVRYWVRAYAGADSSDLSQPVGECDFALP